MFLGHAGRRPGVERSGVGALPTRLAYTAPMTKPPCEPPIRWHGAVMAGGAARRFGSDKVFAHVGARRMIDAAVASLRDAESLTVLLGAPERAAAVATWLPAGCTALPDDHTGLGPVGGLATALRLQPRAWTAVLAADLPLVPRSWWPWLAAQHTPAAAAIVPRQQGGRWEPLAALYHGTLGADLARALDGASGRQLGFQRWLDALHAAGRVSVADPTEMPADALLNVNRPEDAAAVQRALGAR